MAATRRALLREAHPLFGELRGAQAGDGSRRLGARRQGAHGDRGAPRDGRSGVHRALREHAGTPPRSCRRRAASHQASRSCTIADAIGDAIARSGLATVGLLAGTRPTMEADFITRAGSRRATSPRSCPTRPSRAFVHASILEELPGRGIFTEESTRSRYLRNHRRARRARSARGHPRVHRDPAPRQTGGLPGPRLRHRRAPRRRRRRVRARRVTRGSSPRAYAHASHAPLPRASRRRSVGRVRPTIPAALPPSRHCLRAGDATGRVAAHRRILPFRRSPTHRCLRGRCSGCSRPGRVQGRGAAPRR